MALLWAALPALGQGASDTSVTVASVSGISPELIETRLEEVEASDDLDEEAIATLVGLYRKALAFIELKRSNDAAADAYALARKSAPEKTQTLRTQLDETQAETAEAVFQLPDDPSARDIDQLVQQENANQAALVARLALIDQQLATADSRLAVARQRLLEISQLTEKLAGDLKQGPSPDDPALSAEAKLWLLTAHVDSLNAEIQMLDQELFSRPMRLDLLLAQRETARRSIERTDTRLAILEDLFKAERRSETEEVIAEADDAAAGEAHLDHPVVADLIVKNRLLGDELTVLNDRLDEAEEAKSDAAEVHKEIGKQYQTAQHRVAVAGLSQALGQVLHEQRRDLPDLRRYEQRQRRRVEMMVAVGLRDIQLDAENREVRNIARYADSLLADLSPADRERPRERVQSLVASHRTLLKRTSEANTKLLRALGGLDFEEGQTMAIAEEFDAYLAERLLWVRSKGPIELESLFVAPSEILVMLAPGRWMHAIEALAVRFRTSPVLAVALLLAVPLLVRSGAHRRSVRSTGQKVGRPSEDGFHLTLQAIGYSLLVSLPWPILSGALGQELVRSLEVSNEVKAIGVSLLQISWALFILTSLRVMCMKGGLAEVHFRWSSSGVASLRFQLSQLFFTFLLPLFIFTDAFARDPADYGGELARIAFLTAALGITAFLVRLLRPKNGIVEDLVPIAHETSRPMTWFRVLLAMALPLGLALAALAGYLYSATTLMTRLISTLWLVWGLVIVHELVARWLLLVRQRLWLQSIVERREADRQAQEREESQPHEDVLVALEEPELDIASIDTDTRLLLNVGLLIAGALVLSAIWSSVMPALAIFRQITLWEKTVGAIGGEMLVPVTLAEFGMALLYAFITYISARSLPRLLEVLLRQRGNTDAGSRLAYATLTRYLIVLLGVALTSQKIGFSWGNIQWLVAALGVGIGFGLQEIVANFISGLIILVERPIRVGDIVTVGDVSGVVTRLRIRATTITNWDRQELLVPNKEFVTNQVLNWSLSDEVIRAVLTVGVEYGTDVRKAMKLVREAVEADERVFTDPKPQVTFDEFGDNSLNITARAFHASLSNRREIISDLNLAINDKLTEAGIVVAFPQRDVHLDTSSPLEVRVRQDDGGQPQQES